MLSDTRQTKHVLIRQPRVRLRLRSKERMRHLNLKQLLVGTRSVRDVRLENRNFLCNNRVLKWNCVHGVFSKKSMCCVGVCVRACVSAWCW